MDSSEYARLGVYSQESAPGIIVAHGWQSILSTCSNHSYCAWLWQSLQGGGDTALYAGCFGEFLSLVATYITLYRSTLT